MKPKYTWGDKVWYCYPSLGQVASGNITGIAIDSEPLGNKVFIYSINHGMSHRGREIYASEESAQAWLDKYYPHALEKVERARERTVRDEVKRLEGKGYKVTKL